MKKKENTMDDQGKPREAMPPGHAAQETQSWAAESTAWAHIKEAGISGCSGRNGKPPASNQPGPPCKWLVPPEAAEAQGMDITEATVGARVAGKGRQVSSLTGCHPKKAALRSS